MKAIEHIRLIGKEFKDTSDDELMLWIEMVRPMVSKKQFGKLYDQAIAFLVCHKMKMAGHGESPLGDMALSASVSLLEACPRAVAASATVRIRVPTSQRMPNSV